MVILTCFLIAAFVFFLINIFTVNHQTLMNNITQKSLSTFLSILWVLVVYKYGHKSKNCSSAFPDISLRFIFGPSRRLSSFFHFKDIIPMLLRSRIVYQYKCQWCGALYFDQTRRHLHNRISEHMGVSPSTGKKLTRHSL